MATPSNAEFNDIVITPGMDTATSSDARRHEVKLDGISVIVDVPEGAFDTSVILKAKRLTVNELENNQVTEAVSEADVENTNYSEDAGIRNTESEIKEYPEDSISLDIHFEDENHVEIEPLTAVYVNIKIDNGAVGK